MYRITSKITSGWLSTLIFVVVSTQALAENPLCQLAEKVKGTCTVISGNKGTDEWKQTFVEAVFKALMSAVQPKIIAVTPSQLPQNSTADLSLIAPAAHFTEASQLTTDCGLIVSPERTVPSLTQMIANVTVPATIPVDTWCEVTVTTGSEVAKGNGLLKIIAAPPLPTIVGITPTQVSQNTSTPLLIYGQNTHFTNEAFVDFNDSGITTTEIRAENDSVLKLMLTLSQTARVGFHDVTVTTGSEVARENQVGPLQVVTLTVPQLIAINPSQATPGQTVTVTVMGQDTQFTQGASILRFGGSDIQVLSTLVDNVTQLTAQLKIAETAIAATYDTYVTTAGETVTLAKGFSIFSPTAPTITLDKNQGMSGDVLTLTVRGQHTHFQAGSTQIVTDFEQIMVKSLAIANATQATAVIQIAENASSGLLPWLMVTGSESVYTNFEILAKLKPPEEATKQASNKPTDISSTNSVPTSVPVVSEKPPEEEIKPAVPTSSLVVEDKPPEEEIKPAVPTSSSVEDKPPEEETKPLVPSPDTIQVPVVESKDEPPAPVVIQPAVFQFSQANVMVDELGTPSTVLTVWVQRTGNCQEAATIQYEVNAATATLDQDYQILTSKVLSWSDHDCYSKPIEIAINHDTEVEADETFSISLLPLSDLVELGTPKTVQITIHDDDKTPVCNVTQTIQPANYDLVLQLDAKPVTLTFANVQSQPMVIPPAPDGQVATLKLPIIYENGAMQVEITPAGVGETTLVIGDCASQTTIRILVEAIPDNCQSDLTLDPATVTLLENDKPLTLIVTGGAGNRRLQQAPNGEVVTLLSMTFPDYTTAQFTLAPRQAGKTQLIIADCAKQVSLDIQVLKAGSYAYYCWLEGKTDGICENPDDKKLILSNSVGIDARGHYFTPATRFDGNPSEPLLLPNETKIRAQWTVWIDPLHQKQAVELITVAKRQTPENSLELFMLDGDRWQPWDGQDLASLTAITNQSLSAILEQPIELDNLLSPERNSGEWTLYFGYRLDNGSIIFNGNKPLLIQVANNRTTAANEKFRTYFKGHVDATAVTMTITVDPHHYNQLADILIVIFSLTDNGDLKKYLRLLDGRWIEQNDDNLAAAEDQVKLKPTMTVSIFTADELARFRREFASSKLMIYVGYRLQDQVIVYNEQPMVIQ